MKFLLKGNGIHQVKLLENHFPQYPLPVVMISALNNKVFDALEAGAVDFVNKPSNLTREQLNNFLTQELARNISESSTTNTLIGLMFCTPIFCKLTAEHN